MNITVVGTNRVEMKPERATLHITISCENDDPDTAMADCTNTVNYLRAGLDELKAATPAPITWFAVLPIQTRAWTPYHQDPLVFVPTRYSANAIVKVKFCDFGALSTFAARYGGDTFINLNRVEWTLTEVTKNALEVQVLTDAVKDAAGRAMQIARAAGNTVIAPVEIADPGLLSGLSGLAGMSADSGDYGSVGRLGVSASKSADRGIDLMPEDVAVAASVHARYSARP